MGVQHVEGAAWRRSSACSEANNCVEVRVYHDRVQLRSSREPRGALLSFTVEEWEAFLSGAVLGEFGIEQFAQRAGSPAQGI